MNQMNNDSVDVTFQEEVSDDHLSPKTDRDDRIFIKDGHSEFRTMVLICVASILIIVSILSILFGLVGLDNQLKERAANSTTTNYNLLIAHSNQNYGGVIDSFSSYNTLEKAFVYEFNVSNSNPININYSVEVLNTNYESSNLDLTSINYSLLKNDVVVKSGSFQKLKSNSIYNSVISSQKVDRYALKVWSKDISNKFSFKINILV